MTNFIGSNTFNRPNDIVFTDEGGAFVAEAREIVGGVYFPGPGAADFIWVVTL